MLRKNLVTNTVETLQIKVNGSSMKPLISDGDEVVCKLYSNPISINEIKSGVIYLSRDHQKEWIIHRGLVLGNRKALKGDFSLCLDRVDSVWGEAYLLIKKDASYNLNSSLSQIYAKLSYYRVKNFIIRKMSLLGMIVLTSIFLTHIKKNQNSL